MFRYSNLGYISEEEEIIMEEVPEHKQIELIEKCPLEIKYIKNLTKKAKLAAINKAPYTIKYMDNVDEEIMLIVVKKAPWEIRNIKNPTKKVQLALVNNPITYQRSYGLKVPIINGIHNYILPYITDPEAMDILERNIKCLNVIT